MKKVAFILYDSRSGSTLLASLLNRYSGVLVTLESAFVSRIFEMPAKVLFGDSDRVLEYLSQEIQFTELCLDEVELSKRIEALSKPYLRGDIIKAVVDVCALHKPNAELLVIKHPPYSYLNEVIGVFPDVRFIQIIRDGRGVYHSKINAVSLSGGAMADSLVMAAWDWRWKIRCSERVERRLFTVRYEDLVSDTRGQLAGILKWFRIGAESQVFSGEQTDYFVSIGSNQRVLHKNIAKDPSAAIAEKWKSSMTARENNLYSYIAGKELRAFGYDVPRLRPVHAAADYYYQTLRLLLRKLLNFVHLLVVAPGLAWIKLRRRLKLVLVSGYD